MLADLESKDNALVAKAAQRVAAEGDEPTKRAAARLLIAAVGRVLSKDWRELKRPILMEANRTAKLAPTPEQLEAQLEMYAAEEAGRLFMPLAAIGGAEAIALLLEKAEDTRAMVALPKAAIAALSAHPPTDKAMLDRLDAAKTALAEREVPRAVSTMDSEAAKKAATAALGGATVTGGPVENASAVMAGMAAGFRRCYVRALEEDASTKGTVTVTLELDAKGAVTSSKHEAKQGLSKVLASCVALRAESASFSAPKKLPATIEFSVTFKLQE